MSTNPLRRLYALLVAINDYPAPVSPLLGCVHDLERFRAYLQNESKEFDVRIRQLVNSEATKSNVVHAFSRHFEAAGPDDVVLFYFSGHGTREEANRVFWPIEEDRKLESIVCYDSYRIEDGRPTFRLLADKEIRYLIGTVAHSSPHILTIFDCCHSGGNTRNGFIHAMGEDIRERRVIFRERLSQAFPERRWEEFIFAGSVALEDAMNNSVDRYLPEGRHIHMAACQNDESAFEVAGQGVFTKNLLEVLTRSQGAVTYFDLQARIQNYLRNQFKQTPKTYVAGPDESTLFLRFLNKRQESKPLYGNVSFNETEGWIIDLGAMHGLNGDATVRVEVGEPARFHLATIREIYSNHAGLRFDKALNTGLDPELSYKGYSTNIFVAPLNIFLGIDQPRVRDAVFKSITTSLGDQVTFAENTVAADYVLSENNGEVFLSRPAAPAIPILPPIAITAPTTATIITNYLKHLTQFEFVKNLQNPNTFLFTSDPVEIQFFQKDDHGRDERIAIRDGDVVPKFVSHAGERRGGSIRIKLRNKSDRKLYCALLYLTFNFAVMVKLLKDVVVGLEPNAEVWALDGSEIGLTLEEEVVRFNYRESVSTLKLIVSTSDFKQQAVRFELPALPSPLATQTKGLDVSSAQYNPREIDDWLTKKYNLKIPNPHLRS